MNAIELGRALMEASPGSNAFRHYARSLASLAFSANRAVATEASRVVLSKVVQPLADRFCQDACDCLAVFMAEAVHAPRSPIASAIAKLGYPTPQHLIERYGMLDCGALEKHVDPDDVEKAVVISRADLKADIAVTSPILSCAMRAFYDAEIEIVGPRTNCLLIGPSYRLERNVVSYSHDSTLGNQLKAWTRLRAKVASAIQGFDAGRWLVVDPDSWMTQFGLLPLADDRYCRFFDSRSYAEQSTATIAELANEWANQWFFWGGVEALPYVVLGYGPENGSLCLARESRGKLAGVSFSVDGRKQVRLGADFEDRLMELLRRRGYQTVVDCGREAVDRTNAMERIRAFGGSKSHLRVTSDAPNNRAQLLMCGATIPNFSGWVRWASVYIGYDSAISHAVGSVGVPSVHLSVGAPNSTYRARWTPTSDGEIVTIPADDPTNGPAILDRIGTELNRIEKDSPWAGLDDDRE
ncbi:MAG: hypothetical protein OXC19_23020 [Bryobacterales bacterium]|nr:hypothetical protein [Bryobacterales bacterium]